MGEQIVYLEGSYVKLSEAKIPVLIMECSMVMEYLKASELITGVCLSLTII